MARLTTAAAAKTLMTLLVGVAGLSALAACDRSQPDVDTGKWSAITDRNWPAGDMPDDARLDANPQRTNVVVVLDMSGSMGNEACSGQYRSKAQAARAALATWTESVPRDANLGLIAFSNGRIETLVPLGTDNRDAFVAAADKVHPGGGTPLRSAMQAAHELLSDRARYQLGYGRYQIVMITDGEHSDGENPLPEVERILGNPANPVEIHTIGFCIDDSALRQPGFVHYQSANDPEQLAQGLSSVLAESTSFEPVEKFDDQ